MSVKYFSNLNDLMFKIKESNAKHKKIAEIFSVIRKRVLFLWHM